MNRQTQPSYSAKIEMFRDAFPVLQVGDMHENDRPRACRLCSQRDFVPCLQSLEIVSQGVGVRGREMFIAGNIQPWIERCAWPEASGASLFYVRSKGIFLSNLGVLSAIPRRIEDRIGASASPVTKTQVMDQGVVFPVRDLRVL